jgi:hypothetical protein
MSYPFHLCPDLEELHCRERLNYVLGQVLGVKEFQQEQTYFLHQNRLHNRSLHGYGTVWGLAVQTANTGENLEIQVAPGFALDTQGREVWVDTLQCANFNAWLAATSATAPEKANWQTLEPIAEDSTTVAVYVTLCYHSCPTGAQPILGNPCRADTGEEGVIQNTRIRDEFELQLRATPPRQWEEDWVRSIANLLGRIDIDPDMSDLDGEEIATLTQTLRDGLDDPNRIPGMATQFLPQAQAENVLRDLFRYWVTHTRPVLDQLHHPVLELLEKITVDDASSAPSEADITAQIAVFTAALDAYEASSQLTAITALTPVTVPGDIVTRYRRAILHHWSRKPMAACRVTEDNCVLLAAVQFRLTEGGSVDETTSEENPEAIAIEDLQRPYLLHTRLIQELVLQAFIQNSVDELALGSGTARYSAPTEADADLPGVFPVEPMPDGVNVAFDVVVPNPTLGNGEARYANGDESSGVFPVESLPDGTNVAFNVVMPAPAIPEPTLGNGTARFAEGEETTGVFPVSPLPEGATVAFDVVMPEPPAPDLTLGEGTVSVEGTLGAGRRASGVYPAAGALSNEIAFDVVLPRAPELQQIPQIILRPVDMILSLAPGQERINLPAVNPQIPLTPATLTNVNGYPALAFDVSNRERQGVAAFSTLRPPQVDPRQPPILRLYYTAVAGAVSWRVTWRWLRSLEPRETFRPDAQLIPDGFQSADIESFDLTQFYLHRSPSLTLEVKTDEPDYLMVYLVPDAEVAGENLNLYLLMAELRWEVTQ